MACEYAETVGTHGIYKYNTLSKSPNSSYINQLVTL